MLSKLQFAAFSQADDLLQ